jgi:hypothetical protein
VDLPSSSHTITLVNTVKAFIFYNVALTQAQLNQDLILIVDDQQLANFVHSLQKLAVLALPE